MKQLILITILVMSVQLYGQTIVGKGVIAGVNSAKFIGENTSFEGVDAEAEPLTGNCYGGYIALKLNDKITLRPEVHLSTKGSHYEQTTEFYGMEMKNTMDITLNYLDVPILFVHPAHEKVKLLLGPSFGLFQKGTQKATLETDGENLSTNVEFEKDAIESMDMAFVAGVEIALIKGLSGHIRYSHGLKTVFSENDDIKNSAIQLFLSYGF